MCSVGMSNRQLLVGETQHTDKSGTQQVRSHPTSSRKKKVCSVEASRDN